MSCFAGNGSGELLFSQSILDAVILSEAGRAKRHRAVERSAVASMAQPDWCCEHFAHRCGPTIKRPGQFLAIFIGRV
jgi:hypothetical protein